MTTNRNRYRPYTSRHLPDIAQVQKHLSPSQIDDVQLITKVLPFRTNNYVVNELIDWKNVPDDPVYKLNFPQTGMLLPEHRHRLKESLTSGSQEGMERVVAEIRLDLNPHPAGQLTHNVPLLDGERLHGVQHKYSETVLFFPHQGQTCHAYCTFCFRWPQFVGMEKYKLASDETHHLKKYIKSHPQVTDLLFTGGDPLIMRTRILKEYVEPLLNIPHLRSTGKPFFAAYDDKAIWINDLKPAFGKKAFFFEDELASIQSNRGHSHNDRAQIQAAIIG